MSQCHLNLFIEKNIVCNQIFAEYSIFLNILNALKSFAQMSIVKLHSGTLKIVIFVRFLDVPAG